MLVPHVWVWVWVWVWVCACVCVWVFAFTQSRFRRHPLPLFCVVLQFKAIEDHADTLSSALPTLLDSCSGFHKAAKAINTERKVNITMLKHQQQVRCPTSCFSFANLVYIFAGSFGERESVCVCVRACACVCVRVRV